MHEQMSPIYAYLLMPKIDMQKSRKGVQHPLVRRVPKNSLVKRRLILIFTIWKMQLLSHYYCCRYMINSIINILANGFWLPSLWTKKYRGERQNWHGLSIFKLHLTYRVMWVIHHCILTLFVLPVLRILRNVLSAGMSKCFCAFCNF